ncbi:hypothetical protein ACFGVS_00580 [Mucilaginibacter sp. AW1-7]|uniref:hypothetical protein n=1 Tax=Mucilaginibacter sp. AW1-7 TaxID=3349874 RepID=UPI003F7352B0
MKKGKIPRKPKSKSQLLPPAVKKAQEVTQIVSQPLKKERKRNYSTLMILLFAVPLIYVLLEHKKSIQPFSCVVSPYKELIFKPRIDSAKETTSVMCGCLNDSIAHEGILLAGNNVIIGRKSSTLLTNYLLTAPTPTGRNLNSGFTFNVSFYCFKSNSDLPFFSALDLRSKKEAKHIQRKFDNLQYLSIITSDKIGASSFGKFQTVSFTPVDKQRCDIKIISNDYKQQIRSVEITEKFDARKEISNVPNVELLGDSVSIIWKGKPKILGEIGQWFFPENFPDTLNYINVLIIKSPFATRINALGWHEEMEKSWRREYMSQFKGFTSGTFVGDIPLVLFKSGKNYIINPDSIKPAPISNTFLRDTALYEISINKILPDSAYNALYKHAVKDEGFFYTFNKGAYSVGTAIDMKISPSKRSAFEKTFYRRNDTTSSADEKLELYHKLMEYYKDAKKDTTIRKKIKLSSIYFRYPPLPKENSISLYNEFDSVKLIGATGMLNVNGDPHPVDENNIIEMKGIRGEIFEYPALTMGINNPGKLRISGTADVILDGTHLGRAFYETKTAIILLAIMTIIGCIVAISQISPVFDSILGMIKIKPKS